MAITVNTHVKGDSAKRYSNGALNAADVSVDLVSPAGTVIEGVPLTTAELASEWTINLGYVPKRFRLYNTADGIVAEWREGMAAGYYELTLADGTRTYVNTNDAIHVYSDGNVTIAVDTNIVLTDGDLALWDAQG